MNSSGSYRVVKSRYGALKVFANDIGAVTHSLLMYGEWAENEISFLKHFIEPASVVLDIGAYIGSHTLAFANTVGPNGRVIAIEAQPETFELLKENIALNSEVLTEDVVQVYHAIAGSTLGQIRIPAIDARVEGSFGSASLVGTLERPEDLESGSASIAAVEALTIDSLQVSKCDLIKIDVEGLEHLVLQGGLRTLENCRPVVYCECNSLAAGLKAAEVLRGTRYKTFAHVVDAFNPNNFLNAAGNIFGEAREVALVGVPLEHRDRMSGLSIRPFEMLLELENADDLALALLNKPQYQSEVLRLSRAAETGGVAFLDNYRRLQDESAELRELKLAKEPDRDLSQLHAWLTERDAAIKDLQTWVVERDAAIADLQTLIQAGQRELTDRQNQVEGLTRQAVALAVEIGAKDREVARLNALIADLCSSRSWKITRPLRWTSEKLFSWRREWDSNR